MQAPAVRHPQKSGHVERPRDGRRVPRGAGVGHRNVVAGSKRRVRRMELHFIADDLEEHAWYVDLVADFVEDVEAFLAELEEAR